MSRYTLEESKRDDDRDKEENATPQWEIDQWWEDVERMIAERRKQLLGL
jgi:hypothetical protein